MKKIFLLVWLVVTVAAVYWGVNQSIKLSDNAAILGKKDQYYQDEIKKLKASHRLAIEKKDQKISELNKTIETLSAPKDIAKTLSDLSAQIRDIENQVSSLNSVGKKLSELKLRLRSLREECGHGTDAKADAKKTF